MAGLIEDLQEYDFNYRCPSLVLAADALTLGKMTDVLLVARPGVISSTSAATAKEF